MWDLSSLTRDRTCSPLQWKHRVLTTGPLGKSLATILSVAGNLDQREPWRVWDALHFSLQLTDQNWPHGPPHPMGAGREGLGLRGSSSDDTLEPRT